MNLIAKGLSNNLLETEKQAIRYNAGLGNVDNTSDADKPVSTATQAALDLKTDKSNTAIDTTRSWVTATQPNTAIYELASQVVYKPKPEPVLVCDLENNIFRKLNTTTGRVEDCAIGDVLVGVGLTGTKTIFNANGDIVEVNNTDFPVSYHPETKECIGLSHHHFNSNSLYPSEPYNAGSGYTYAFGVPTDWAGAVTEIKGVKYDKLASSTPLTYSLPTGTHGEFTVGCFWRDDWTLTSGTVSVLKASYHRADTTLVGEVEITYDFTTKQYSISSAVTQSFLNTLTENHYYHVFHFEPALFAASWVSGDYCKLTINGTGLQYGGFSLRNTTAMFNAYQRTTTAAVLSTTFDHYIDLSFMATGTDYTFLIDTCKPGMVGGDVNPALFQIRNTTKGFNGVAPYSAVTGLGDVQVSLLPNTNVDSSVFNRLVAAISVKRTLAGRYSRFLNGNSETSTDLLTCTNGINMLSLQRDSGAGSRDAAFSPRLIKVWAVALSNADCIGITKL